LIASCASRSERQEATLDNTRRFARVAETSSRLFASQTVQVTTDAKARPSITAFTTMSAAMNMPQGDRFSGKTEAGFGRGAGARGSAVGVIGTLGAVAAGRAVGLAALVAGAADVAGAAGAAVLAGALGSAAFSA
jgi:hypothetical protein